MVRDHKRNGAGIDRRRLLQGVGALGVASVAGCLGEDDDGSNGDGDDGNGDGDGADQSRAVELIQEGFEEEGFEPPYQSQLITNENPERIQWVEILQQTLNNTEFFDLELQQYEWTTYQDIVLSEESSEEDSLAALGWSAGWDPDNYVNFLLHSDFHTPQCCNVNHYENEEVDQLIDDGIAEMDEEERVEIYDELQRTIAQESPLSFIRFGEELIAYREESLGNWSVSPFDSTMYNTVYNVPADTAIEFHDPRDDGELIGAMGADINNFDPIAINDTTSSQATALVYEQLLGIDYEGNVQPYLAEDWEQTDDLVWEFALREGVEFHNGEELTAEHVVGSMERYEGAPREADVYDWLGEEGEVRAVDDYTVEIEIPEPYAPLLNSIAAVPIVPMAAIEEEHDLQEEPIGTGPYEHEEYRADELYRISRYDNHWFEGSENVPEEPEPETVQLRVIVESSVRQSALETGDVDIANPPPASFDALDDDDEIVTDSRTSGGFDFLIHPIHHEPFNNPKVRRGVSLLIPREQIIESVYDGIGVPAYGPISPVVEQYALDNDELIDELEG